MSKNSCVKLIMHGYGDGDVREDKPVRRRNRLTDEERFWLHAFRGVTDDACWGG